MPTWNYPYCGQKCAKWPKCLIKANILDDFKRNCYLANVAHDLQSLLVTSSEYFINISNLKMLAIPKK